MVGTSEAFQQMSADIAELALNMKRAGLAALRSPRLARDIRFTRVWYMVRRDVRRTICGWIRTNRGSAKICCFVSGLPNCLIPGKQERHGYHRIVKAYRPWSDAIKRLRILIRSYSVIASDNHDCQAACCFRI